MGFQGWLGASVVYSVLEPVKITLHMMMALIIVAMLLLLIHSTNTSALKEKFNLTDDEIAYIGDDTIDIPVMELVGVPIATENASIPCKAVAIHITEKSGGYGAFREAVEWILTEQGQLANVFNSLRKKVQNQK